MNNDRVTPKERGSAKREGKGILAVVKALILGVCFVIFWIIVSSFLTGAFLSLTPCHWVVSSFDGCMFYTSFFREIVRNWMIICLFLVTTIGYLLRLKFIVLNVILLASIPFVIVGGFVAFKVLFIR